MGCPRESSTFRGESRTTLNTLVAIPNVSASCPLNTCPYTQPDGTTICLPCLAVDAAPASPVPALDVWAALALGAALVAAGVVRTKGR
jgi:hypothetical protein